LGVPELTLWLFVASGALQLLGATNSAAVSLAFWSIVAMGIYSFFGPLFSIPSTSLTGFSAVSGIALMRFRSDDRQLVSDPLAGVGSSDGTRRGSRQLLSAK
jgi:hypothetical protein